MSCLLNITEKQPKNIPGTYMRNFWDQRVIWVRISKQRGNRKQDLGNGKSRRPLFLKTRILR
jgi:hypothetical protein